nr:MAG TPA_asm: hypothetical protein [Caudoviricetes sp.]
MLICVKSVCKCLIIKELRNLRRSHLSRYFICKYLEIRLS